MGEEALSATELRARSSLVLPIVVLSEQARGKRVKGVETNRQQAFSDHSYLNCWKLNLVAVRML